MSRGHFRDQGPLDCKVYVGGLGEEASRHELWDIFEKYGTLKNVWVARNPPGFAFIEYEDHNDAADAVEHLDQRVVCNRRVKVQLSTGESRKTGGRGGGGGSGGSGGGGGFRGGRSDQSCYNCGRPGHIARDCHSPRDSGGRRGGGGGGGGRYSSNSSSRRDRSRSNERKRSPSRSRSRSPVRRSRSRSRSGSHTKAT